MPSKKTLDLKKIKPAGQEGKPTECDTESDARKLKCVSHFQADQRAGLAKKFDFSNCMAVVDMKWRDCRDVSGAFITTLTLALVVVALLWAALAAYRTRTRAERNIEDGKPLGYSVHKIQRPMVKVTGTLIVRDGQTIEQKVAEAPP